MRDAASAFLAGHDSVGPVALHRRDLEIPGVRRDGTRFPMMASTSAITVEGSLPIVCCIARDLSEQENFQEQLAYQTLHDALTGLPNRSKLTEHIDHALTRGRRHRRPCGVLFVDLDRFKVVNDTHGHAAGDHLLVEAAARIRTAVRDTDVVARLGGDELVVYELSPAVAAGVRASIAAGSGPGTLGAC